MSAMMPSTQAQTVEIPKRLPMVQTPENRAGSFTQDSQLINCYAEKTVTGEYEVYKRPGFSTLYTRSGFGRGGISVALNGGVPAAYFIFTTTVYRDNSSIGTVAGTSQKHHFQLMDNSGTGKLVFGDRSNAYYTDGATVTHIVDADFPTSFVPGWAYLDGTLYVMTPACNIQGSAIEDPSSWDPLNTISARSEPGLGMALLKHLTYVVALKQNSTEAFYNAGNPTGSPLTRVSGAFSNYGCYASESVQQTYGTALWITSTAEIGPQVVRMDNLRIRVVSTPAVDRLLEAGYFTNGNVFSWVFRRNGHRFYALSSTPVGGMTIVYDIDQDLWYLWAKSDGTALSIVDVFTDVTLTGGTQLAQDFTNGKIYIMDSCFVYPTDDGTVFPVDIYTPSFDGGVDRRKVLSAMYFDCDRITGNEIKVRYSDDDYTTWSNFQTVDIGVNKPRIGHQGTFYQRAYNLRHLKPLPFRIKSTGLQLDIGTL